jgi:hypothetical protein
MLEIPEGTCGDWRVVHQAISEVEADRINWHNYQKNLQDGDVGLMRFVQGGVYTSLCCGDVPFMSDHHFEVRESARFAHIATGDVLVSGLGLGVVIGQLGRNSQVRSVTVLENSPEVIELVGPHVGGHVIKADAFTWEPPEGVRFDWAWHDIWPDISPKNAIEMVKLYSHHRPWCDKQMFWSWPQIIMHVHRDIEQAMRSGNHTRHGLLVSLLEGLEVWTPKLWPDGRDYLEV